MRNSLQLRLSLWLSVLIVVAGALAGALALVLAYADANELQDDQLRQLAALVDAGRLSPAAIAASPAGDASAEEDTRIVVEPLTASGFPPALSDGLHTLRREGEEWRVLFRTLHSGQRVVVGQRTALRDELAFNSAWRTLLPVVALVPALLVLVAIAVRRTVAPLTRLARRLDRAEGLDPPDLRAERLAEEVEPFVAAIERLVMRLRGALDQHRRFVADAAHELRSPIAALTVQADNLARADLSAAARERLEPLIQGLARTRTLLEQLLSLARLQASGSRRAVVVPLEPIAREVVETLLPMAQARRVDLGFGRIEPVAIRASAEDAAMLLRNVVENALRHSPAGATVTIALYQEHGDAVLAVEDDGPGIPVEQRARVFDAFYRGPGAAEEGSGLGLALVRGIAERWGASVRLEDRAGPGSGLRFEYRQEAPAP
ncbi:MAG TPA: ATP-binding protein [Caldimonas sp.]|jgi:two-component system OmpR family sensor kinase|nr:ATP-binding protein [Caldimonas sp.]